MWSQPRVRLYVNYRNVKPETKTQFHQKCVEFCAKHKKFCSNMYSEGTVATWLVPGLRIDGSGYYPWQGTLC